MPDRSTVIYRYDGSYQGFLCCVAQCFQDKALPVSIRPYDEEQQSLYGCWTPSAAGPCATWSTSPWR